MQITESSEKNLQKNEGKSEKEGYEIDERLQEGEIYLFPPIEMPRKGTAASRRLIEACQAYAENVELSAKPPALAKVNPNFVRNSESERRKWHNKLCVMLFGTNYQETPPQKRDQAARFALAVAGKDEYIDF